ncbi:hypothetical protein CDAR_479171 [Caerostris darwini]|uniref:Uncharacterized protein n=1 Tax=Caerostris darwini TaxID=1538125 RepID=A0AAV4UWR7_9ARAC|nr:hypothetical protein CDAR_479171 [Caerostris darwini]
MLTNEGGGCCHGNRGKREFGRNHFIHFLSKLAEHYLEENNGGQTKSIKLWTRRAKINSNHVSTSRPDSKKGGYHDCVPRLSTTCVPRLDAPIEYHMCTAIEYPVADISV